GTSPSTTASVRYTMSRFPLFDRSRLKLLDVSERGHDLSCIDCRSLVSPASPYEHPDFLLLIDKIAEAHSSRRPIVWMMGAHPVKLGLSRFIIDLIERRLITHGATNGAGLIHDYELALVGGTSEDVAKWIALGQFGLWKQSGTLNDLIRRAFANGEGLGEAA